MKALDYAVRLNDTIAGTLWTRTEASRRIGITRRVGMKLLNSPIAWLENQHGSRLNLPLFSTKQLDEITEGIAKNQIRIQPRSLRGPKRGVYQAEPLHTLADDLGIETIRVGKVRAREECWLKFV